MLQIAKQGSQSEKVDPKLYKKTQVKAKRTHPPNHISSESEDGNAKESKLEKREKKLEVPDFL